MAAERKLRLLRMHLELRQAQRELRELKNAIHEEVDALQEHAEAKGEVEQLAAAATQLDTRCMYGAPNWSGGDGWGPWLEGKEVHYSYEWCVGGSSDSSGGVRVIVHPPEPVRLQLSVQPFALGGVRAAYYARDGSDGHFVAKRPLLEPHKLRQRLQAAHLDAHATAVCRAVAKAFCHPSHDLRASIVFLPCSVVVLEDSSQPGGRLAILKEPYIYATAAGADSSTGRPGEWVKWTRNDGHMFEVGKSDDIIQALTHFSLLLSQERLNHECMILDAQGVRQPHGDGWLYNLTDPALCSADRRYGATDCGQEAMRCFLHSHVCSLLCERVKQRLVARPNK